MANPGDFRPLFGELARYLKQIERHTNCFVCNTSGVTPSAAINVANAATISDPVVAAVEDAAANISDTILTGTNPTPHVTSAGAGIAVPAGFKSVTIIKTSDVGTVTITLSDGSTYDLTAENEVFSDVAAPYFTLPAYGIASADSGTWKWHGIQ